MEAWRVYRTVVADSHHFDEEPDPEPHDSEKLDHFPDPHLSDSDPQPWLPVPVPFGRYSDVCRALMNFDICASISGAVQYKLTNLVLGNSLPLQLQHQQGFIEGTPHLL